MALLKNFNLRDKLATHNAQQKFDTIDYDSLQNPKWYKGDQPTTSETMFRLMEIKKADPLRANELQQQFYQLQCDPTSIYYNPYIQSTNQAINDLASYGIDVSNIDDQWFTDHADLQNYYRKSGSTNTPSAPTKKSSAQERMAYDYYQIFLAHDLTQKAKAESEALRNELTYLAQWKDRNYSDEDILDMVDLSKYKTLYDMKNSLKGGKLLELNEGVDMATEDWMRGVLWAARNGGSTGSSWKDMAMSASGKGTKWREDPAKTAKLNQKGKDYRPYEVSMTADELGKYFGRYSFTQKDIDEIKNGIDVNNTKDVDMFNELQQTENDTVELEQQLKAMHEEIDDLLTYMKNPDDIISTIKENSDYKELFKLDETMDELGRKNLVKTTRPINYKWSDIEKEIREKVAQKESATVTNNDTASALESTLTGNAVTNPAGTPATTGSVNTPDTGFASSVASKSFAMPRGLSIDKSVPYDELIKAVEEEYGLEYTAGDIQAVADRLAAERNFEASKNPAAPTVIPDSKGAPINVLDKAKELYETDFGMGSFDDISVADHQEYVARAEASLGITPTPVNAPALPETMPASTALDDFRSKMQSEFEMTQRRNLAALGPAFRDKGTDTEKLVFKAGGGIGTSEAAEKIANLAPMGMVQADIVNKNLQKKAAKDYLPAIKTIREYDDIKAERSGYQKELDDTEYRIKALEAQNRVAGGASDLDVLYVNELKNMDGVEEYLRSGDPDKEYLAYRTIYNYVTNEDMLNAWTRQFGVASDAGSMEEFIEANPFLAEYASYILNGIPEARTARLTAEEEEDLNSLYENRDYLSSTIADLDEQLNATQEDYDKAIKTRDGILNDYSVAQRIYGTDVSSELVDELNTWDLARSDWSNMEFDAYTTFQRMIEQGVSPTAARSYATRSLADTRQALNKLNDIKANLANLGITATPEDLRNVDQKIEILQKQYDEAYRYIVMGSDEFASKVEEGRNLPTEGMSRITRMNVDALNGKTKLDYLGDFNAQFIRGNNIDSAAGNNTMYVKECIDAMTQEEKDYYFWCLANGQEDKANEYFRDMVNPINGMIMSRVQGNRGEAAKDYVGENNLNMFLGWLESLGTNVLGGLQNFFTLRSYEREGITNFDPKGLGFGWSNRTSNLREGISDAITEQVGEKNAKVFNFFLNALTSAADSTINSVLTSGALKVAGKAVPAVGKLLDFVDEVADGKYGKILGVTAKATRDFSHAVPMAIKASDDAYREWITKGTPEQAQAMANVTFWAESLSEAITVGNIEEMWNRSPASVSSLFKELFKNGFEEAVGEGANQWFEDYGERVIMQEKSTYDQTINALVRDGIPRSEAVKIANQQMIKNVAVAAASGFVSSLGSSANAYVAGQVRSQVANETILEMSRGDFAKLKAAENATGGQNSEITVSAVLRNGTVPNARGIMTPAKTARQAISAAHAGIKADAAATHFVGKINGGDGLNSLHTIENIVSAAGKDLLKAKDAVTFGSLTNGETNRELQRISQMVKNGEQVTEVDVNELLGALDRDTKGEAAEANNKAVESAVLDYRKTVKELANAANGTITHAEALTGARDELVNAKKVAQKRRAEKEDADAHVDAVSNTVQSAVAEQTNNPTTEGNGPVQQSAKELEGAINDQQEADTKLQAAQEAVNQAQKKVDETSEKILDEARMQANTEVTQEIAQEQEEEQTVAAKEAADYEEAVKVHPPTQAFGKTFEVTTNDGDVASITGVYDWNEVTDEKGHKEVVLYYMTEDGHIISSQNVTDDQGHMRMNGNTLDMSADNASMNALDKMINRTGKAQHPKNRPLAYFPQSITVEINGQPVEMVGIVGQTRTVDGFEDPVIMDINGNIYSIGDDNLNIPFEQNDTVQDLFYEMGDALPEIQDVPAIQVTEVQENDNSGSEQIGPEQEKEIGIPVQGAVAEGDNQGELATTLGRDAGLGDNSDVGSGAEEGSLGRGETSEAEYNRSAMGRRDERFRNIIDPIMEGENKNANSPHLQEETDYGRFSNALNQAKENNSHGLFVDEQTPKSLEEKGAITLLSPDGMAGVAIGTKGSENGNIVGVFNNSQGRVKHTLPYLMLHALDKGGKKLDCYDGFLSRSYEQFGFVPVARVKWSDAFHQNDGWNYERDGRPDVIVWMHVGDSAETVARRYAFTEENGGYHRYSDEEMANLPVFDDILDKEGKLVKDGYTRALEYRDQLLEKQSSGNNLVISHSLSVNHAIAALKEGGMASPSLGITKEGQDSSVFYYGQTKDKGPVVFLFGEDTINPETNRNTNIYGDDAYTPTIGQLNGIIEYKGDGFYYTETGKRATLEDVLREMGKLNRAEGAHKLYNSLESMKKDSGRLVPKDSRAIDYASPVNILDNAAISLFNELSEEDQDRFGGEDEFSDAVSELLPDLYKEGMTAADMQKALASLGPSIEVERGLGVDVSEETAGAFLGEIERAIGELTDYFEAKPERIVSTQEIIGAVVPEGATELLDMLNKMGIPSVTYKGDNPSNAVYSLNKTLQNIQDTKTTVDENGNPQIKPKVPNNIQAMVTGVNVNSSTDVAQNGNGVREAVTETPTQKHAKKLKKKLKSPQQIAKTLVKSLGFGDYLGSNNFGNLPKNIRAYWEKHAKYAAVKDKDIGDYHITFHETGHGIAQKLGIVGTDQMVNNLIAAEPSFRDNYTSEELKNEAMAEFMWRYMENDQRARDFAGDSFVDYFERQLNKDPSMAKAVREARSQFQQWVNASDSEQTQARIRYEKSQNNGRIWEQIRNFITRNADSTSIADDIDALVGEMSGERGKLRLQSLFANHSQKRAVVNLTDSLTDANGTRIGDGLGQRLTDAGFVGTEDNIHTLERYMLLLHSFDEGRKDKPVFGDLSEESRQKQIDEIEAAHPEMKAAEKAFQEFRHDFLQAWMVDTGYWTQEFLDHLEEMNPHYAPTFRVRGDMENSMHTGFGRSAKKYTMHAATGGSEDIYSPFYSFVGMVDQITSMISTNDVAKLFDQYYRDNEGMGVFGRMIPGAEETALTPSLELNAKQQQLVDLLDGKIDGDIMEQVLSITKSNPGVKQANDKGLLTVHRDDGTVVRYEIDNPELYKLLTGAQGSTGIKAMQIVGNFTRMMSMLTTGSNPLFAARNAVRDYQNSVNYGSWATNYLSGLPKWASAFIDVMREADVYKEYEALGGGGWTRIQQNNSKSMKEITNEIFGDDKSNVGKTAKWLGKKVWDTITMDRLNEIIEQTSRLVEYKYGKHDRSTAEGRKEAFQAAQDVTVDFSRSGNSETAYVLKKLIPFFGAATQGVYRTGRMFTEAERGRLAERLTKTAVNTAITSALAAGLILRSGDDDDKEEYMMLSDGVKANHLVLPNPLSGLMDGQPPFLRIPLAQDPFTYAVHNLVTNALVNGSDDDMAISLAATADVILDNLNPLGGTIFQPFLDVSHNKTWYGSNIVRTMQEDWVDKSNQYNEDTPEVFKFLGRLTNQSPEVIEYLATQYTGFLGAMAIPALSIEKDGSLGGFDAVMNSVIKKWTTDPLSSNDVTKEFYDKKNVLSTVVDIANADRPQNLLLRSLTQDQVNAAYDEASALTSKGGIVYEAGKAITNAYKEIDQINGDDSLTDEQKYKQTRDIKLEMLNTVEAANEAMQAFYKKYVHGESLTDRLFGAISKGFTEGKKVHIKTPVEKLPDAFQNDIDADSVYMQRVLSVYNGPEGSDLGGNKSTALPHPAKTFTSKGKDYEIPDKEYEQYSEIYRKEYENYIMKNGKRWDSMTDTQKYDLLQAAHRSANDKMKKAYISNSK